MAISEDDVLYVAKLARLSLSGQEVKAYSDQLGQILGFINRLNEVDVSGIEPTASSLGLRNITRPDQDEKTFETGEMLQNAPEKDRGHFAVPQVIE